MSDDVTVTEVVEGDDRFGEVLDLARQVLEQDRYLVREYPHALESHVAAAFVDGRCVGFLRFLVQVIGSDAGRPPIRQVDGDLTEGYVEAFGVTPGMRRRGFGGALQNWAIKFCRSRGCYQMRSRSPTSSTANYELKLQAGYTVHPSEENDSYYFALKL